MKIAYLMIWDLGRESGVTKKVRSQLAAWRRLGHQTGLFVQSRSDTPWSGIAGEPGLETVTPHSAVSAPAQFLRLVRRLAGWRPDVVYLRFCPYKPAMELLWRTAPVVIEANTLDAREFQRVQGPLEFGLHLATRARVFRKAAGIVAVTDEVGDSLRRFGPPVATIPNGIELASLPVLPGREGPPRIGFVGSAGCPWHGVDDLVALARTWPELQVEIIGYSPADIAGAVPENVRAHGPLTESAYREILAGCDAAVGSLALHRNHMREACPLKVREYLALGLPVILGYQDSDFPRGAEFILRVPASDGATAASRTEIEAFLAQWRGRRVDRAAIATIDLMAKERRRLALLQQWTR